MKLFITSIESIRYWNAPTTHETINAEFAFIFLRQVALDVHLLRRNVGIDAIEHHGSFSEPIMAATASDFSTAAQCATENISIYERLLALATRVKDAPADEPVATTLDKFLDLDHYKDNVLAEINLRNDTEGVAFHLIGRFDATNWKRWRRHHSKVPYDCGTPFGRKAGTIKRLYDDLNVKTTTDARKIAARCMMAPSYIAGNQFEDPVDEAAYRYEPCEDIERLTESEAELSDTETPDD
mgnify:CR=1 FL=1